MITSDEKSISHKMFCQIIQALHFIADKTFKEKFPLVWNSSYVNLSKLIQFYGKSFLCYSVCITTISNLNRDCINKNGAYFLILFSYFLWFFCNLLQLIQFYFAWILWLHDVPYFYLFFRFALILEIQTEMIKL